MWARMISCVPIGNRRTRRVGNPPQVDNPPPAHHFRAAVETAPWISCKLHTRIGSRRREAIASTDAFAPLMVVMHGTR